MAAAEYLSALHTELSGHLSATQTPLEFLRSQAQLEGAAVWLLSAGGKNVDIVRTLRKAIQMEPAQIAVLCAAHGSPLAKLAARLAIDILEYEPPAGKDGFLATNSLAAFLLVIARAYSEATKGPFADSIPGLLGSVVPEFCDPARLQERFAPLFDREHWLVLYDPACRPIASDLESRFSEAALGSIKASDLRNFAHGRHHWLAKRASSSAVVVLSQPATTTLAMKSLALLPRSLPHVHVQFSDDPILAPVGGILLSMRIAGWAGEVRGIDPGRPGVPEFGRRLYNLSTKPVFDSKLPSSKQLVARKTRLRAASLHAAGLDEVWETSLARFRQGLYEKAIRGIVFDYDGTLVEVVDRFHPPKPDIANALIRLLTSGIWIGIATGRGRSARRDLQKAILPPSHWAHVLIGYHNGAELGYLDDQTVPESSQGAPEPAIAEALDVLKARPAIWRRVSVDPSHSQLGLQWKDPILGWRLIDLLEPIVPQLSDLGIQLVTSGHSVDLLAPGVSKKRVITQLAADADIAPPEILVIGDRGLPPGNDAEMLSHQPSLSVDEVSRASSTCWRFTPPMLKGTAATLWYLSRLALRRKHPRGVIFRKGSLDK
ncbi:MAG: sucrose-6-phosphate hydrolase [Terriglobia bacterium]|nr:MAG: sucrose-6-phosphate hydrolase [Terriglobia bacterium]